jgi:chromosomal replication initiation ATPase DnaA
LSDKDHWEYEKARKKIIKDSLMVHPEKEYVYFIQNQVAYFFNIKPEYLRGKRRFDHVAIPRYICIKIVNLLTEFEDEAMYFFNRDRTSWYDVNRVLETFINKPYYANALKNLLHLCSRTEYENFKNKSDLNYTWEILQEVKNQL